MKRNKELEFEIIDNKILNVLDYDWFVDRIDVIYVRHSETGKKCDYAIYIQQGSEIVELYLRTPDELLIAREFKKLCNAIKEINPMFDNSVEPFVLINYSNLKNVSGSKNKRLFEYIIKLQFENNYLNIAGSEKKLNRFIDKFHEINETCKTL